MNNKVFSSPCAKCPYKLGIIKTFINPCPMCKMNGYRTYERFLRQINKAENPDVKNR